MSGVSSYWNGAKGTHTGECGLLPDREVQAVCLVIAGAAVVPVCLRRARASLRVFRPRFSLTSRPGNAIIEKCFWQTHNCPSSSRGDLLSTSAESYGRPSSEYDSAYPLIQRACLSRPVRDNPRITGDRVPQEGQFALRLVFCHLPAFTGERNSMSDSGCRRLGSFVPNSKCQFHP